MKIDPMKSKCSTCPFRDTGWTEVRELLTDRSINEGTPVSHSTGSKALVPKSKRVSSKMMLCRGARDLQLQTFHVMGFLDEPTDEAWDKKRRELGL